MRISEEQAVARLIRGEVVAIPTETVYGLAASLSHPLAIEAIFSLKGRPANNPLIVHLASSSELLQYVSKPIQGLQELARQFWPGPLTLVLPVHEHLIPALARAHLPTAAFRVPLHPIAQRILMHTGPLVAPSANRSGCPSSTSAAHVETDFGPRFPVVDGGSCASGVESTILIAHAGRWQVGRLGAIAPESFAPLLGYVPEYSISSDTVSCPGQHYRHYAPRAQLVLGETDKIDHPFVVGFSDRIYKNAKRLFCLGQSDDAAGCLNRLYHTLRLLDDEKIPLAWVDMRLPNTGLFRTLRERLIRAAKD